MGEMDQKNGNFSNKYKEQEKITKDESKSIEENIEKEMISNKKDEIKMKVEPEISVTDIKEQNLQKDLDQRKSNQPIEGSKEVFSIIPGYKDKNEDLPEMEGSPYLKTNARKSIDKEKV